jgi:glutaredoxin 2
MKFLNNLFKSSVEESKEKTISTDVEAKSLAEDIGIWLTNNPSPPKIKTSGDLEDGQEYQKEIVGNIADIQNLLKKTNLSSPIEKQLRDLHGTLQKKLSPAEMNIANFQLKSWEEKIDSFNVKYSEKNISTFSDNISKDIEKIEAIQMDLDNAHDLIPSQTTEVKKTFTEKCTALYNTFISIQNKLETYSQNHSEKSETKIESSSMQEGGKLPPTTFGSTVTLSRRMQQTNKEKNGPNSQTPKHE